jgi:hypothetical protein
MELHLISRREALAHGLKKYFTGKPCKHGHLCERYTLNKVCVTCQHIERTSLRASADNRQYRQENPQIVDRKDARHKARGAAQFRTGNGAVIPKWANQEAMETLYAEVIRRNRAEGAAVWSVDHIVPLKSPIVSGLHCEANLQILRRRENIQKYNRWWPDMP